MAFAKSSLSSCCANCFYYFKKDQENDLFIKVSSQRFVKNGISAHKRTLWTSYPLSSLSCFGLVPFNLDDDFGSRK